MPNEVTDPRALQAIARIKAEYDRCADFRKGADKEYYLGKSNGHTQSIAIIRQAFTVQANCKAVGDGVPIPMGRAIARAVKEAIGAK